MSREAIAAALFTQLQTVGSSIATYSRRPQLWNDTTPMPALYMGQTKETITYSGDNTATALMVLEFPITLYVNAGLDPNVTPDTLINNLLDAIDAVLAPLPYPPNQQNLGGVCAYARRDGEMIRIPGYLDGQGGVYFTVRVLVPM